VQLFLFLHVGGKDADSQVLKGHGHAFFLPAGEDGDGRIDHLAVVAADGFSADEIRALDQLRQVRFGEGDPLRLLLVGLGKEAGCSTPLFVRSG
jgi:hypothetical protein